MLRLAGDITASGHIHRAVTGGILPVDRSRQAWVSRYLAYSKHVESEGQVYLSDEFVSSWRCFRVSS